MERPVCGSEDCWRVYKVIQKRKRKSWIFWILAGSGIVLFLTADARYRKEKTTYYQEKTAEIRKIMEREKEWIRENQGAEGEIYLNLSNGAGDVNPYFACQAAMGFLTGDVSAEELSWAAQYLSWHAGELRKYEGYVSNYEDQGEGLKPTGKYDSVDSYIAVFLTLLGRYEEKGGELAAVEEWQEAVHICKERLKDLTVQGMTQVSERKQVRYLMDNAEVWEGTQAMVRLLETEDPAVKLYAQREWLYQEFSREGEEIRETIYGKLWNSQEQRFEIGLDQKGRPLDALGGKTFYPDAIVQVYPIACGLRQDQKREKELYEQLCRDFDWEHLNLSEETFNWPVMAYIAAELGDETRAEIFLKTYQEKYAEEREYPLHTAEAGWTARACERLIDDYEEKAGRGLLEDLYYRVKGQ